MPTSAGLRTWLALLNLLVIVCYATLVWLGSAKPRLFLEVIRDWLPLGMVVLAYREMGWFALPHQAALLESRWIVWDRLVLGHGGRAIIESLGPVVPSILEIAYALVYALPPLALAVLNLCGQREMADRFLTVVLLSILLCYVQFPFWPSEPPRVVFAGSDLPTYFTVFRRFNLWMLGNYGIHTSVFPSAHVTGALATAFGFRMSIPEDKRTYRFLFVMAVLIAIATLYGRYHYLADAICGSVIACMVPVLVPTVGRMPTFQHRATPQRQLSEASFVACYRSKLGRVIDRPSACLRRSEYCLRRGSALESRPVFLSTLKKRTRRTGHFTGLGGLCRLKSLRALTGLRRRQ